MADSVQQAPKNTSNQEYCPGSLKNVPKAGYKVFATGRKYKCPDCGKYFPRGWDGTFNKHGFKLAKPKKAVARCAECGSDVYDLDYLCEACRSE